MEAVRLPLRLDITRRLAAAALSAALVVVACGPAATTPSAPTPADATPAPGADALRVVATTTVLADMVRQVGGERVIVESLVPQGGEVHTFDPTPSDLRKVADAKLIIMNGLGLDEWLGRIATDSGTRAVIVEVAEDLEGVDYLEGGHHDDEDEYHDDEDEYHDEDEDDHGDEGEEVNPHLWLNVAYAIKYVERISEALQAADPDHATDHAAGAAAYIDRLTELDDWVREQIRAIPAADRAFVSFHDAMPYFAAAYDMEIVGTVIDAPGQDPSAGQIAALVDAIRTSGAKAIFSEVQFSPALAETVAREAGVTVESELYSDSLGDPPVDTYEGLMRWNVERIVAALAP